MYLCFDRPNNCGDFFRRELVKFISTIMKRNISPVKLEASENAHAQITFPAESPLILPNGNPPSEISQYSQKNICVEVPFL